MEYDIDVNVLLPEQNKFSDNFNYKTKISDKTKRDSWFYYEEDSYGYGETKWK